MSGPDPATRQAQLDKAEREHLEDIVAEMRDRVEANVRYQLESEHDLARRPEAADQSGRDADQSDENAEGEDTEQSDGDTNLDDPRAELVEAIELEAVDGHDWADALEQYVTGVGYTIVNRLAALRCMEVRDFVDEEVTVFREDGRTPASDYYIDEEFETLQAGVLRAYRETCDDLADEIELLFDRSTAYSLVDPDFDTFEDLCDLLDEVPDAVWRADDVLGWVYEYYNVKLLDDLRRKGDREGLEPEDVPAANQFYTPHWVVRMLTDNSLGKLYLEDTGDLQDVVEAQSSLSPDERKDRPLAPDASPGVGDFCTYLVPSEEAGEPPAFDGPEDLRVIDPACGSGHFLLYAFDVLERIWRAERPDVDHAEIPREILQHNLYGVDLDMRACQLAAFNLYLKGRTRAEAEGVDGFEMPDVGIVCADAKVADMEGVADVFDEVAAGREQVRDVLERVLDAFEEVHGLGSLLDVRGTLGELFEDDLEREGVQITLGDDPREEYSLSGILGELREAVDEHRNGDSFLAQDLRSFVRLLDVLAEDYDVALMNPPYGSDNRMPESVTEYVEDHYDYKTEFYINFFEICDRITREDGRVGMLVPRSFMFKQRYEDFRTDFIGDRGSFDFLSEFGIGVLDNATVRTVGTVVRSGINQAGTGTFIRLHDVPTAEKEEAFIDVLAGEQEGIKRFFNIELTEFSKVPGNPISYYTPNEIRDLHDRDLKIDAEQADAEGTSVCKARQGLTTGKDPRFIRKHWETTNPEIYKPISKGGPLAWTIPHVIDTVEWGTSGKTIRRSPNEYRTRNEELYGKEGLTWTYIKETGRRFGYFPSEGLYSNTGYMLIPEGEITPDTLLPIINSNLYHNLILSMTTERHWNSGEVGSVPWLEELGGIQELEEISKEQQRIMIETRMHLPSSPYYVGPKVLLVNKPEFEFFHKHPHVEYVRNEHDFSTRTTSPGATITELAREGQRRELERKQRLEDLSDQIDQLIYDALDISEETQEEIMTEIFLRTAEDPSDREIPDPESVPETPENLETQVKDLVHHFVMEAVRDADDGIVPIHDVGQTNDDAHHATLLDRVVERFHDAYGEHAPDRLVEVDEILGSETAAEEDYPNLRRFLAEDCFAYHVETMENTPICWLLTTDRLVADASDPGFAALLDYHQLDAGLFDRLSNRYLEPRKADLRERRSAARRRQDDESLSTSDRAEAAENLAYYESALEQIAELEERLQSLGSRSPRGISDADRQRAADLAPKVATFREETRERLDTLADLRDEQGVAWFEDTFTENFWDKVQEWREEWLDALATLEDACEAYAEPADEPVPAHLADLFDYFDWRLKGSDHYSSSGILFTTYYFEREGAQFLDEDGEPRADFDDDYAQMLAELAAGLEEYKALADEIQEDCLALVDAVPSDWSDRALSEITTAGYRPEHKHGVAINITPLVEQEVVPEIVEDKVL